MQVLYTYECIRLLLLPLVALIWFCVFDIMPRVVFRVPSTPQSDGCEGFYRKSNRVADLSSQPQPVDVSADTEDLSQVSQDVVTLKRCPHYWSFGWIFPQRVSNAELWSFLVCQPSFNYKQARLEVKNINSETLSFSWFDKRWAYIGRIFSIKDILTGCHRLCSWLPCDQYLKCVLAGAK